MSQTKAQLIDNLVSPITGALGSAAAPTFSFTADPNTGLYSPGADQVAISTGGTGRLFIDSSGRLLVGTSTARSNFFGTTLSALTQTEGTGGSTARGALSVINNDVSNNPPYVLLGRSGAATLGSNAAVVSGSRLGTLTFHGADGTNFIEAATVAGEVDGTPGTNDMPGRLVFSTTADGAASPTERLRIDSSGRVGVGTSSPDVGLHYRGDTPKFRIESSNTLEASAGTEEIGRIEWEGFKTSNFTVAASIRARQDGTWSTSTQWNAPSALEFYTQNNTGVEVTAPRMLIDSSGRVGLGTSSPGGLLEVKSADQNPNLYRLYNAYNAGASSWGVDFYRDTDSGTNLSVAEIKAVRTGGNTSELKFGTSSTPGTVVERVRISSTGAVGIGTSAPSKLLTVKGADGSAAILLERSNSGAASLGQIGFSTVNGIVAGIDSTAVTDSNNGALRFWTTGGSAQSDVTGLSQRMVITLGGLVGIGTTSPSTTFDCVGTGKFTATQSLLFNGSTGTYTTWQNNGTSVGDIGTGNQVLSGGSAGDFAISSRAGSLVLGINTAEKARIDTSGRLLVGTSSSTNNTRLEQKLAIVSTGSSGTNYAGLGITTYPGTNAGNASFIDLNRSRGATDGSMTAVASNDALGYIVFRGADGANFVSAAQIAADVDGTPGTNDMPGRLVFSTTADGASSPTERMRIQANGFIKVSNTGSYAVTNIANGNEAIHQIVSNVNNLALFVSARDAGGTAISASVTSTSAAGDLYRGYVEASGGIVYKVLSNGNVQNTNNSYGAISDLKLKENIVDANSQWDDLKALQVRNYNFKEGQTHTQIGLVAQEAELVSPGLVTESSDRDEEGNDLGTVTKSVNYSVLYMKAVKALQEAMERIEALEADVAALKGA